MTAPFPSLACEPIADPDSVMFLRPDHAASGWCDYGCAASLPVMPDANGVCSYTALPGTTLALPTTNWLSVLPTVVQILKEWVPAVPLSSQIEVTLVPVSRQCEQTFAPLLKTPRILPERSVL